MARAHLSDLYRRGRELVVSDPAGESDDVTVYIKKLNPLETKRARDKGNAARARIIMRKKDHDSDEWMTLYSDALDLEKETMIEKVIGLELVQKRSQVEAELAMAEGSEWGKDEYLEGLRNSWEDELADVFSNPDIGEDEPEKLQARQVFDELTRFADEVDKIYEHEAKALRKPYDRMDKDTLLDKTVDALFDEEGYSAWLEAYYSARTFHSVRDATDHAKKHFKTPQEVDELEPEVYRQLVAAYHELEIGDLEVKDSEQTPIS